MALVEDHSIVLHVYFILMMMLDTIDDHFCRALTSLPCFGVPWGLVMIWFCGGVFQHLKCLFHSYDDT
jgi:hypothetical protein